MSTFNMVCGTDPLAGQVLLMLGFDTPEKRAAIPRLRDAYVRVPPPGAGEEDCLVILTRTGGANRRDYTAENDALRAVPGFLRDFDDDFDSTFAHWCYDFPAEHIGHLTDLLNAAHEAGWDFPYPMERFKRALDAIGGDG